MYHNYKCLPYKKANEQFIKDYKIKYLVFSWFTYWKTRENKLINIRKLNIKHLENIVDRFGCTYVRENYPLIFYRYVKEIRCKEQ